MKCGRKLNLPRAAAAASFLPVLLALSPGRTPAQNSSPPQGSAPARSHIIDSCTEDMREAKGVEYANSKGGPEHNKLTNISSPIRTGRTAFRHWVDRSGERSELAMAKTAIGETYWYGWSMYLPPDFDHREHFTIVMQLATYPSPRNGKFPCGGNGHKVSISGSGSVHYDLQHAGDVKDAECDEFPLGDVGPMKGKWVDFVMHARWTGDKDGFLRLWMKVGKEDYAQKINYTGRTWWNDEDKGPYFKMGAYLGDPNWKGPRERTLYTDEYRLGNAQARFEDVAPVGDARRPGRREGSAGSPRPAGRRFHHAAR